MSKLERFFVIDNILALPPPTNEDLINQSDFCIYEDIDNNYTNDNETNQDFIPDKNEAPTNDYQVFKAKPIWVRDKVT